MTKRAVFIGRWTPFHKGHLEIMKDKIEKKIPLLILIRDTPYDAYPPLLRKRMIQAAMLKLKVDAKVKIIDDIESVNYGRGVGYEVNEIEVSEDVKRISATNIREMISKNNSEWKNYIPEGADKVLEDYMSKKGIVVWLTGIPKSGKTTIASIVSTKLEKMGIRSELLDSKSLRSSISKDLGFSKKDRDTNLERATFVSKLLSKNGSIVICSFVSPYLNHRKKIRKEIEKNAVFLEIFVKSSIEAAKKRDESGIYKKAEEGKIEFFTGISDPYEEPENPDLILDTEKMNAEQCAERIVELINTIR